MVSRTYVVVVVGNNPNSLRYVKMKDKAAKEVCSLLSVSISLGFLARFSFISVAFFLVVGMGTYYPPFLLFQSLFLPSSSSSTLLFCFKAICCRVCY